MFLRADVYLTSKYVIYENKILFPKNSKKAYFFSECRKKNYQQIPANRFKKHKTYYLKFFVKYFLRLDDAVRNSYAGNL